MAYRIECDLDKEKQIFVPNDRDRKFKSMCIKSECEVCGEDLCDSRKYARKRNEKDPDMCRNILKREIAEAGIRIAQDKSTILMIELARYSYLGDPLFEHLDDLTEQIRINSRLKEHERILKLDKKLTSLEQADEE